MSASSSLATPASEQRPLVLLGFVAGAVTAPASVALRSVWSETLPQPSPLSHVRMDPSAAFAGVLLSGFAAGSLLGGFGYGLRPPTRPASWQYPRFACSRPPGSPR